MFDYAFDDLRLAEVVAHTTARNHKSEHVMRRLGMTHNPTDDFDAPWYPAGHPNRRFILYRLQGSEWRARRQAPTTTQNRSTSEYARGGGEHS